MNKRNFRIKTESGRTTILDRKSGREVIFERVADAMSYIGIMKLLYHEREPRRAMEPYPVRTLCPGNYPIKIKNFT